jgi:diguanylate cyclase (GGDEF)-like protein/PAS domain S-box-containing protein
VELFERLFFIPYSFVKREYKITHNKRTALVCLVSAVFYIIISLILLILKIPDVVIVSIISFVSIIIIAFLYYWCSNYLSIIKDNYLKMIPIIKRKEKIKKYFEGIIMDSSDIIVITDKSGHIMKFNKGGERLLGYDNNFAFGKSLDFLFVNEADVRKIVNNVLQNNFSINEEIPLKAKDGQIVLVNLSAAEIQSETSEKTKGLMIIAKDITEKKKLEEELKNKNKQLEELAITDSLTGLYNVRYFYEQINRELTRLKRNPQRKLSLIFIDLDHFKELNDTEGHLAGDQVLKSLGEVIQVCIRKDVDTGYRYGGDEFAIILPDTDAYQAKIAAERTNKQFSAFKFGKVTLSIGIAEATPNDDEKTLIKKADDALYCSKRAGRARITIYNSSLSI